MAVPARLGARVKLSDDPTPAGLTFQDVDVLGQRREAPDGPVLNLDVTPFVVLDDSRRIETESFGLSIGLRDRDDLEAEVRESVLEEEMREAGQSDPAVAEMVPELDEIAAELREQGVDADGGTLRGLEFVVELDPAVEARIDGPGI
jgi:hypothetical protein